LSGCKPCEAGLPTWTEYYKGFQEKFALKSLRTFQRRQLSRNSAEGRRSAPKKGPKFTTGERLCDYPGMLNDLLDQIERQGDKVPQAIRTTVAEYRRILNAHPNPVPRVTVPSLKAIEKGVALVVSKAVKSRRGKLIVI
jgi:hypothetical protein